METPSAEVAEVIAVVAGWVAVALVGLLKRVAPKFTATTNLRQIITTAIVCGLTVGFAVQWRWDWAAVQQAVVMFVSATMSYRWVVKPLQVDANDAAIRRAVAQVTIEEEAGC